MSSVRCRSARTAPSKKIHPAQNTTGMLSSRLTTSSRSPNGAGTSNPRTSRPIGDHSRIGIDRTSATRNRRRMSATMSAIDMPACPP
jgi:hypothetical protein